MEKTRHADLFAEPAERPPAPQGAAERVAWLRLARARRVGPATFRRLLAEYGAASAALAALPEIAASSGVRRYTPPSLAAAEAEMETAARIGARLLCLGEPAYPPSLVEIEDAPPCLWAMGRPAIASRPVAALVGARNASALGVRMASALAEEASQAGIVVASGLARGIDTAVHRASLAGGTIAVLAGGLDCIYPKENTGLAEEIAAEGLLLTEAPMGLSPQAHHFPPRNRIISGVSKAVVVVEGALRSGSLITARNALDQGRDVLAVPGHPFDARAAGCNALIRDGATLVRSGADIVSALGHMCLERPVPGASAPAPGAPIAGHISPTGGRRGPGAPDTISQSVLNLLGPGQISEDQLIRLTGEMVGASPADVLNTLSELDIVGRIIRHPGGLVSRP